MIESTWISLLYMLTVLLLVKQYTADIVMHMKKQCP